MGGRWNWSEAKINVFPDELLADNCSRKYLQSDQTTQNGISSERISNNFFQKVLEIVKEIQSRVNERAMTIQRAVRRLITRPLHVQENKFGDKVFKDAESRNAVRIVE